MELNQIGLKILETRMKLKLRRLEIVFHDKVSFVAVLACFSVIPMNCRIPVRFPECMSGVIYKTLGYYVGSQMFGNNHISEAQNDCVANCVREKNIIP
jgi:hypothetical protein